MLTDLQQQMLTDFGDSYGYGRVLVGWNGQTEIFKDPAGPPLLPGPLDRRLAGTFIQQSYFLVSTQRPIKLYRGFESAGLSAPFGKDHPSYILGLVAKRDPGRPDRQWWMPKRPSISIDNLGLPDLHRGEDRADAAILREWNGCGYFGTTAQTTGYKRR